MAQALAFSVLLFGIVLSSANPTEDELIAVSLLYRHGDRTPTKFYPNDPYQDPALWPNPMGQLTNIGKRQHYELGQWLRNRYNGFLSPTYEKDEIYIRSSDVDRCLMSAASNLAGLYPPVGKDQWRKDFSWQPIPIHSMPKIYDDIAEFKTSCSTFKKQVKKVRSEYFKDYNKKNEIIYEYLTHVTGQKIKNFKDAGSIYGTLRVEEIYNFTLPEWSIPLYPKLKEFKALSKEVLTYTPKLNRLANGRLFDNIIKQFTYFANETKDTENKLEKFRVFSAHDTQVSCILDGLKVPHDSDVPYAATIIFELRRTGKGKLFVNFFYKSQPDDADLIQIQGCDKNCDFDDFLNIMTPLSITETEFKKECDSR